MLSPRHIIMATGAVLTAMTAACGSGHSEYVAGYAAFDSVPYNIETNTTATTTMVKTFPGSYMFMSQYPQYDAVVRYGIVNVDDQEKIHKTLANHFDRMADRIGIYESEIRETPGYPGFHGWVMVTPQCGAPVQMLVTDSATMMLHATMEFNSQKTDTAGMILPAVQAIAADMEHIIKHLRPAYTPVSAGEEQSE